jgi:hypothetical protein
VTVQGCELSPKYFLHRFPFREIIHELIEVADFLHETVFHLLDFISTDCTRDECASGIEFRFSEKGLEINSCFEGSGKSGCIISCEPQDDLIELGFGASFFLGLRDIRRVDGGE